MSRGPLLIVGASTRSAAASARRRGWQPHTIDLFADRDTRRLAVALACPPDDYPHALPLLARSLPPMPWCYTGGLENHPEIVDAISADRPLLGNPGAVLRAVRDPFRLADSVTAAGGQFPHTLPAASKPPSGKAWLVKSLCGTGGTGIREPCDSMPPSNEEYWQECIRGEPVSASFETDCGGTAFRGMTMQLNGTPWLHAPDFHYCGNIRLPRHPHRDEFIRVATRLAADFSLAGRWGLDAIANDRGLWIIELNPREGASMELFDHPDVPAFVGKAIYYAAADLAMPDRGPWDACLAQCGSLDEFPRFADLSEPGTAIPRGQPVLTFFAAADSLDACIGKMKATASELDKQFGVAP